MFNMKQAFYTNKHALIGHSLNQAFSPSTIRVVNKPSPKIVQYMLTSNFIFDLSCLGTLRLEKNVIKEAFKKNFCREFPYNCDIKTAQMVLGSGNFAVSFRKSEFLKSSQITNDARSYLSKDPLKSTGNPVQFLQTQRATTSPSLPESVPIKKQVNDCTQFKAQFPTLWWAPIGLQKLGSKGKDKQIVQKGLLNSRLDKIYPFFPKNKTTINKKWINNSRIFKGAQLFGRDLMCANWILNKLIEQLNQSGKRSPRPIVNQFINEIRVLIEQLGSKSPIIGMRITISGRLSSRKKSMAQQLTRSVGKVPTSTFRQKVDYSQGFVPTRFGKVGVKVWVTFSNSNF
jgi:hypothetical protein